ncbi:putative ABC transport system ATP-binding protein [Amycolatopsis marina]|uniref:Putative ABC transport system ATP-binding protein n=1 Tax=Amycolatopsis marina TaxID=490629 RepID=A0A1I1AZC5_9PSEU|nr:ABC transporter ATP-binding protein [Amycolatopsis marina]SFB42756.1 putative ABC transport system ATP-binding protein [Amycolatopsis marina]
MSTPHGSTHTPQADPVISLRDVARTFPVTPPVTALSCVDLVVNRGEYVAVVGPSGSGKSTLLHLLGLLDRPTSGVYELNGTDVSRLADGDRTAIRGTSIGFVFQAFHLLPHRTAVENVSIAMLYAGVPASRRTRRATEALDRVGLGHRARAMPTTLSGGERQRVAVARALVNRPSLLLCDEPTGNLDTGNARSVLELIQRLHHDEQLTIIMITHDPQVAARATRTIEIRDGILNESMGGHA